LKKFKYYYSIFNVIGVKRMLSSEERIVLIALYLITRGSTKANFSIQFIRKKLPKKYQILIDLSKTLKRLEKKGLIWVHYGRKANGGKTYGITREGIKLAKQLVEAGFEL